MPKYTKADYCRDYVNVGIHPAYIVQDTFPNTDAALIFMAKGKTCYARFKTEKLDDKCLDTIVEKIKEFINSPGNV